MSKRTCLLILIAFIGLVFYISGCQVEDRERVGKKLATRYCGSCHHVPDPASLTKKVWEKSIFRQMSEYYKWTEKSRFHYANKSFYTQTGTIPMSDTIWAALQDYFVGGALTEPVISNYKNLPVQDFFEERAIDIEKPGRGVTAVSFRNNEILAAVDSFLYEISLKGNENRSFAAEGLVSGIFPTTGDEIMILDPGILDPHDTSKGALKQLNLISEDIVTIKDSLARPVYLNQSSDQLFVSEYGNEKGAFGEMNLDGKNYTMTSNLPGSYKSFIFDYDKDGNDEVLVMFAQALEGIYAKEVGNSNKRFAPLLSFNPEWGISDVDTADINQDGWTDLIIVNGDNADYSPIPKAYHGTRIYLNDKNGRFEEAYNFPLHGATQVRVLDANGDGLQDILIGAFFALEKSNRLILLLNTGSTETFDFEPYFFENADRGRWMVMYSGDVDSDGDLDIIIGSFEYIDGIQTSGIETNSTDLLFLINN